MNSVNVSIWESLSDNILEEFSTSSVWYLAQCCNAVECINDGCDWLARAATVSVLCALPEVFLLSVQFRSSNQSS